MLNIQGWAEKELKSTLKELADIKFALDASTIVAITDARGILTYVNDKFCEISKYSREELLGSTHRIINSGHHSPDFFKLMWKTIGKGKVWHGEILNRAKDGSLYWVDTTIVPFMNDEGKPYQYVAIRSDITEKKQAEEDLKQTLRELADMKFALDESAIVAITDRRGVIKSVNDTFCKISKYDRSELIGQDHRIINSGFHSKEFFKDLWRTIAQGKVWKGEVKNKAKDGTYYWVDTTIVPFLDDDDKPYQYVAIRSDITERKETEELLRRSERLSIVSKLAAGVAHEIRNPLVAVKRMIRLLQSDLCEKEKSDTADADGYFSLVLSELDRIEVIMNEYLMLAKPQVVKFQQKNLQEMLSSTVTLLDSEAHVHDVTISALFEPGLPSIFCDEHQLKQVFINIIKNAIEAMPNGGKLEINANRSGDNTVLIQFKDNGIGMSKEKLKRLGEPFYTTKEGGTGLGLMVTHGIIDSHKGCLGFDSEEGKGTAVTIALPIDPS